MTGVRIVTDSACDLPADIAENLRISIVPLTIRFGDDEFVDRDELGTDEFWERCRNSAELPETAAPSPGAFEQVYRSLAAEGADAIVTITLSGDLSATIEAARSAARAVEDVVDVTVVDSRTITLGQGLLAITAAEAARDGAGADEVVGLVEALRARTRVHGALDTLENLKKGGRIGAARSLLGSLLSIKPLIEVRDGVVVPNGQQRTRARALRYLVDLVRDQRGDIERLAVMHAACPDVDDFAAQLAELVDTEIVVGQVGPVVGTHAGVGTIGVVFQVAA